MQNKNLKIDFILSKDVTIKAPKKSHKNSTKFHQPLNYNYFQDFRVDFALAPLKFSGQMLSMVLVLSDFFSLKITTFHIICTSSDFKLSLVPELVDS